MAIININNENFSETILENNLRSIVISNDEGYEPIVKSRDILIDELGFTLEEDYGITDMTQMYFYQNKKYFLKYLNDLDMVVFETVINNEAELKLYRELAFYLKKKIKKEKENVSYSK